MADGNTESAENTEEPVVKSKKKLIIIILLVGVLAVGLSVAVTLYLIGGSNEDELSEQNAENLDESVKNEASYLDIKPPFLVTFNVNGRQRYMQVSLSVSSRDPSVFNVLEYHMPLIRSRLISTYGGMDFNTVKTKVGKIELQTKTVDIINSVLESEGDGKIENVYFTNFVLQ